MKRTVKNDCRYEIGTSYKISQLNIFYLLSWMFEFDSTANSGKFLLWLQTHQSFGGELPPQLLNLYPLTLKPAGGRSV
jgi:hypothetical protein